VSCAEVVPPPGGEEDTVGPSILLAEPATGSVNVPSGNKVTIRFSERIIKPTTGTSVNISPRPSKPPKLKWGADHLTITFPENFQPNRTYTISLNSGITDLRRKSIEGISSISFSTGPTIDSGHLSGTVFRNDLPATRITAALFKTTDSLNFATDSLYPDYLLFTDPKGQFSFKYIADGSYHLLVFDDKNRNELFDSGDEAFGLPDRPIVVGTNMLDSLAIRLQEPYPDTLRVVDAAVTKNQLVRLRLNRPVQIDSLRFMLSMIHLKPVDPQQAVRFAQSFLEQDSVKTPVLTVDFGALPVGVCSLSFPISARDTISTKIATTIETQPDTERPRVLRLLPSGTRTQLPDSLILLFSEPIRIDSSINKRIHLTSAANDSLKLKVTSSTPFSLRVKADKIRTDRRYQISIDTTVNITDRAGNPLSDSIPVAKLNFIVLSQDSLGKISGTITNMLYPDSLFPTVVTFQRLQAEGTYSITATRQFSIDLPGGKYLVSAFVDHDLDGQYGLGQLQPFVPAEQFVKLADTITVRPRFDIAGMEIRFK
jgi:hypothetical protein